MLIRNMQTEIIDATKSSRDTLEPRLDPQRQRSAASCLDLGIVTNSLKYEFELQVQMASCQII
jgi:hypothetical protein